MAHVSRAAAQVRCLACVDGSGIMDCPGVELCLRGQVRPLSLILWKCPHSLEPGSCRVWKTGNASRASLAHAWYG